MDNLNHKISAAILAKIVSGMTVKDAIDAVLGEGQYDKIASDIYDSLQR